MVEMTFYARGDSSTANNAALNVQNVSTTATTTLVFQSGATGDIKLDYNGGNPDPNTTLLVNGVATNFTVEFSGNLPTTNKLSNVNGEDLRGKEIVVITVTGGQRYFFLTDGSSLATMDDFPNGAHAITSVNTTTTVMICFLRGTLIRTPNGDVPIEKLAIGDLVSTADGDPSAIRWISSNKCSATDLLLRPALRPVCIPQSALAPGCPYRDLWVSPLHRMVLDGFEVEFLFGEPEVLVTARDFPTSMLPPGKQPAQTAEYFHILLDRHEIVFANGARAESLFPGDVTIASMTVEARAQMVTNLPELVGEACNYGPTVRRTLKRHEASVLDAYVRVSHPVPIAA
jgi:hypothetical protein